MQNKPKDTYELANKLIEFANLLKSLPNYKLLQECEITNNQQYTTSDYSKMKVAQLKNECKRRNIKITTAMRKQDFINMLTKHDKGETVIDKISRAFGD
jgi:uncharacterized membrane protein